MFFRRPSIRRFEYIPKYYDPDKDPAEKFKRRFGSQLRSRRGRRRTALRWIIAFLLVVYAYLYLSGFLR